MLKVKATAPGVYNNHFKSRGDVFEIEDSFFTEVWMEKVIEPPKAVKEKK